MRGVVKTRFYKSHRSSNPYKKTELLRNFGFGTSGPLVQLLMSPIKLLIYVTAPRQATDCFTATLNALEGRGGGLGTCNRVVGLVHCSQFVLTHILTIIICTAVECHQINEKGFPVFPRVDK